MRLLRVLCLGAAIAGLGCGSNDTTGTTGPGANEIWMQNTAFNPATRSVATGTTITFVNKDAITHTATANSAPPGVALFDSGIVVGGGSFQQTFTVPGTYQYQCVIHAGMNGTITVF